MDVYISGVGMTKFGRLDDPLEAIMAEASAIALRDAQLEKVDAIYIGVMNVEEFIGESNFATLLANTLGLTGIPSTRIETASSTGAGAFETAFYAIASGYMKNVLVVAGEKMTHLTTPKINRILSEVIDRTERRYGATMAALAAMIGQRYAYEHRIPQSRFEYILSEIAIKNHFNGSLNPYAQFQKIISKEEYFSSKMISYPLRLYDCAPISDGASAIVLTSNPTHIKVSGIGHATDTLALSHRTSLVSFNSTKEAAKKAYQMAQVNPSEIQFAEIHDAFTPFEIIGSEDLGLFPPGKAWEAIEEKMTYLHGRLPINPSGGLKSRGHPIGASGLAQLVEIVYQLRGEAGEQRQLRKADIGLAQSIGGIGNNNFVIILERTDRKRNLVKGWKLEYHSEIKTSSKVTPSLTVKEGSGILETFTTLYSPPEGFKSPLTLGLVKTKDGERIMACNPDYRSPKELKIGVGVYLKMREGIFVFEKKTLRNWLKRILKFIK